jgi:hypothetical protein
MNYGEVLDVDFKPDNEYIYEMFVDYYKNPLMTKMKDIDNYSLYIAKAYCLLNKDCRYLMIFTNIDINNVGFVQELKNIHWISLQTRTFSEDHDVKIINYTPIMKGPLTAIIEKVSSTKDATSYKCLTLPLTITLLHTDKKTQTMYQQRGNIISALETYETIITFTE